MALTEKDVRELAEYACIALTDTELADMRVYMNDAIAMLEPILNYADEDVDPTFHPAGGPVNVMRDDDVDDDRHLPIDEVLKDAASTRERSFRVPSILGEGGDR